jgi:hypothetical protein
MRFMRRRVFPTQMKIFVFYILILYLIFSVKVRLKLMLIITIPKKNIIKARIFFEFILLNLNRRYPGIKLMNAHKTLVKGEDNPLPGGLEKGEGKGFPEIPFTK